VAVLIGWAAVAFSSRWTEPPTMVSEWYHRCDPVKAGGRWVVDVDREPSAVSALRRVLGDPVAARVEQRRQVEREHTTRLSSVMSRWS
jgi:hypothetical protein